MRILLTNDDGVTSPGLSLLAESLREDGYRVFILAPDSDRSGVSHAISFFLEPRKIIALGTDTWSCSGTPADCVALAVMGAIPESEIPEIMPDLVISGINKGANLGTDILYSGTAAAARQASLLNLPAVALSLVDGDRPHQWDMAVSFVRKNLSQMRDFWKPGTFVNVNMPNGANPPLGLKTAFPSRRHYTDYIKRYCASDKEVYCFVKGGPVQTELESGSDQDVVNNGYASISAVFVQPVELDEIKERGDKA